MAYYDALIAGWNNPTQPPPGVTGTGLTAGMSTETKLGHVNAWTVTGSIPTSFYTDGAAMLNCIDYNEFKALQAVRQTAILDMLCVVGPLLSGTANSAKIVPGMMLDTFPAGSVTRTAMTQLAKAATAPWWQYSGYLRPFDMGDIEAAGLS